MQYNNFEIFRVREPLVPVETMEKKQQVAAFAWEPSGDRFALVLGDVPKLEVTFYTMKVRVFDKPRVELGHRLLSLHRILYFRFPFTHLSPAYRRLCSSHTSHTGRGGQERTPRA